MQICPSHWAELRDKISELGLEKLVSKNGEEAIARFNAWTEDPDNPENFDPLFIANMNIITDFIESGGDVDIPICPVCRTKDREPTKWINETVEELAEEAKDKGLLTVQ